MRKSLLIFYGLGSLLFAAGIAAILHYGVRLQDAAAAGGPVQPLNLTAMPLQNLQHPLGILLVQIIVVIATAKLFGLLFRKIRQPAVIGEMLAGILLGPSLLGLIWPDAQAAIFPKASLGTLQMLSQLGVILFMFFVGIELDLSSLRRRAQAAIVVSHASIVAPFFLGSALALGIYTTLAPAGVAFAPFALFMGTAMSVTAFPVLARIIEERELGQTPLGITAIACAAVDDVTAWCILAVVVAIAKAQGLSGAVLTVALSLLFIGAMVLLVKPRLAQWANRDMGSETRKRAWVVAALVFALGSALCTEAIGIHALFGAFLAGAIMPPQARLSQLLKERVEIFGSVLLLPLFFAFTGLRTQIGLLDDPADWLVCGAVITVAIAGKFGGSMLAARFAGLSWHDSAALGALMNTRGLMELIALNIGYDLGILSPKIFAMMVIMALVTTCMTGPMLGFLEYWKEKKLRIAAAGVAR